MGRCRVSQHPKMQAQDRALARRIAVLMRVGTVVAAVLLSGGVLVGAIGAQPVSTVLLVTGCATLVLLPIARLMLMAGHFARTDRHFLWISLLVLVLVISGAAVGLLTHPL